MKCVEYRPFVLYKFHFHLTGYNFLCHANDNILIPVIPRRNFFTTTQRLQVKSVSNTWCCCRNWNKEFKSNRDKSLIISLSSILLSDLVMRQFLHGELTMHSRRPESLFYIENVHLNVIHFPISEIQKLKQFKR